MVAVRPERPEDVAAIHAVHKACFPSAGEARLVDLLLAADRLLISLVAEVGGVVIGHIAFSPVRTTARAIGLGLAPIGVVESYRRRGIAAALIRSGLETSRAAGYGWVVVLGDPAYYGRFGFHAASPFGLFDEYDGGPAFQAVELIPGSLPVQAGLVRYASEFASLE